MDFDASASFDPDNATMGDTIAEYTFDFGDGTPAVTQASPAIAHTYTDSGNYHAFLTVMDSRGKSSTNTAGVVIQVIPEGDFFTVTPCRLLDTRTQEGGAAPVAANSDRVLDVDAVTACGVSPLATAVALNITVTQPTGGGHLTVYAADLATPPGTSTLNFKAGDTRANNAIPMLSGDGQLKIRPVIAPSGSTHVIVDVVGFFIETP
ncbi:MAG TPA: PKD domain-containing protein [Thermoanaerobaculia bacterium]|nr:PKD domain-containing protein [Thermoanaerobaculia bacterium]